MQQLLCEPEDRLGSQTSASVSRPNSIVVQSRRNGFMPQPGVSSENDGAHLIKVLGVLKLHEALPALSHFFPFTQAHPWFKGIDWQSIHKYPAPYKPDLHNPEDTRHFDSDIPPEVCQQHLAFDVVITIYVFQPLAPANGAPADATKDPLLKHEIHGAEILDVRKALAFAGFTHKSPRTIEYMRAEKAFEAWVEDTPKFAKGTTFRGRPFVRETRGIGLGRAISM